MNPAIYKIICKSTSFYSSFSNEMKKSVWSRMTFFVSARSIIDENEYFAIERPKTRVESNRIVDLKTPLSASLYAM